MSDLETRPLTQEQLRARRKRSAFTAWLLAALMVGLVLWTIFVIGPAVLVRDL